MWKYSFLVLESPKLGTVLYMWPHKHWIKGYNHLPQPADYSLANTAQYTTGCLCFKNKQLTDLVKLHPASLLLQSKFLPHLPPACTTPWLNSNPATGLPICLLLFPSRFLSCIGFFLISLPASRLRATVKHGKNSEFPRQSVRYDSLTHSQPCNQGILTHNTSILHKQQQKTTSIE